MALSPDSLLLTEEERAHIDALERFFDDELRKQFDPRRSKVFIKESPSWPEGIKPGSKEWARVMAEIKRRYQAAGWARIACGFGGAWIFYKKPA